MSVAVREATACENVLDRIPLLALASLTGLVVIAILAGAASAWQEEAVQPMFGTWQTGSIHEQCGSQGVAQGLVQSYMQLYRNGCEYFDDFFGFDISRMEPSDYIAGARVQVSFWSTTTVCAGADWAVRPVNMDPLTYAPNNLRIVGAHIEGNPNWDTYTNTHDQTRTFDASPQLLAYIRTAVSEGNSTLRLALVQTSQCTDSPLFPATNMTVTILYDNTPPGPPGLPAVPSMWNATFTLQWTPSTDNASWVTGYQCAWATDAALLGIGGGTTWLANNTTTWTFSGLPDGRTVYFAVRARDAPGLVSDWAITAGTLVDGTPPTIPQDVAGPAFVSTPGFNISWSPSDDGASGVVGYSVSLFDAGQFRINQRLTNGRDNTSVFLDIPNPFFSTPWPFSNEPLTAVVQSVDRVGHLSSASWPVGLYYDTEPPANVSLITEPLVSPGTTNTISWNASADAGVGGVRYSIQMSSDLSFVPLAADISTSNLSATLSGLSDGAKLYYRVMALDAFGHPSAWSITYSTQDNVPPPAPVLEAVRPWINTPTVSFGWSVTPNSEPIANGSWKAVRGGGLRFTESQGVTTGSDRIALNISHAETIHFCVAFQDVAGLTSNESCADTTADFEPPHTAISPTNLTSVIYTPGRQHFEGTAHDDLSGVAFVEYSETTNHTQWERVNGEAAWDYDIGYGPGDCHYLFRETTIILFVRSTDLAGNVEENPPWTAIRLVVCPVPLRITSPANGSRLSGTTLVVASAPSSQGNATLQYQRAGGDWVDVDMVSEPTKPGSTNLGLMWDTSLVEDGPYWLRVILKSGSATVPLSVTVANARIALMAGDLIVDPASPKAGGTITLRVHPVNIGSGIPAPTWMNWTVVTPSGSRPYSRLLTSDEMRGNFRFATDLLALDLNGASHFHIDVTFESDDPHYEALFTTGEVFIEPAAAGNNGGTISTGSSADASALLLGAIGAVLGAAGILLSFMRNRHPASSAGTSRVSNAGRTSGGSEAEPDDDMHGDSPSRLWRRDR